MQGLFGTWKDWGFDSKWCEEPVGGSTKGETGSHLYSRSCHLCAVLSFVSFAPWVRCIPTIFMSWQASVNGYSHCWVIKQKKTNTILFILMMKIEKLVPKTRHAQSSGVFGDLDSCFLFFLCFFSDSSKILSWGKKEISDFWIIFIWTIIWASFFFKILF